MGQISYLSKIFLSELSNTVNKKSIFNTKHAKFSIKPLLLFYISPPYLFIQPPLQSRPIILSSTSGNFYLPVSPPFLSVHLNIPAISTSTPFLYISGIFCSSIFTCSHPYNPHQKYFPQTSTIQPIQAVTKVK